MKQLLLVLFLGFAAPAMGAGQASRLELPKLEVSVHRVKADAQQLYEVNASGSVNASLATVWRILTTYDRMEEFVPDLASCRVLSRNGNEVIIEQFGTARFLFMSRSIHLVVRATEQPMSSIDIALVSGDMKHYEARWELIPIPETGGTRVIYSGRLMPNFYVPGILGTNIIRGDIERMMHAVLTHLERQPALPKQSELARGVAAGVQVP
ncbi:cyclase/dehydrase [Pseudoduganella sp. DS3]|uniref:Cyclase/dehydrase n=1 Tax=Pseudoduganella guangdongensis TaxID=2692179 RepID=A0A6N9HCZ2_9BURK|nr:SRPBCC family protein [Pseudoduganella guangdongensis]MYN01310.1 cyclase/dehydrase [Pseudoduganella guangdongensis]